MMTVAKAAASSPSRLRLEGRRRPSASTRLYMKPSMMMEVDASSWSEGALKDAFLYEA